MIFIDLDLVFHADVKDLQVKIVILIIVILIVIVIVIVIFIMVRPISCI